MKAVKSFGIEQENIQKVIIQYLLSCKKDLKLNKNSTYVTTVSEKKISGNKTPEYKMAEYKNPEGKSLMTKNRKCPSTKMPEDEEYKGSQR